MDLIDRIKEISARIPKQNAHIQTEEATKNAFVMPFISALGYDIFNPLEVVPEFTADIGLKKGEKVDYAIKKDDKIIILVECKWSGAALDANHMSQLHRYFHVTEARFAILTNGISYQFYSDIDEPNKMDSKPFFEFNMLDFDDHQVNELKKFTKSTFSLDDILNTASTLKYTRAIKKILEEELHKPSEPFVRFFASQSYDGRITQPVIEQFTVVVKNAINQFINERLNERLKSALVANNTDAQPAQQQSAASSETADVETTQEERDAFNIVKAILREIVDVKRIAMRDAKSYCAILLDDNNRKPICRLNFNTKQKYLTVFENKNEIRVDIDGIDDIFKHADRLKAVIKEYGS